MENILQVKDLKKVFHQHGKRDVTAVENMSFSLRAGEILGIVGESGSGKSTVAKLITRLEAVTEGQIILDGQDITHRKGKALKSIYDKIQMVFQNPVGSFDPRKTLGYGIGESLKNRGVPKAEIRKKQRTCWSSVVWRLPTWTDIPIRSAEVSARELPLPEHWR